MNVGFLEVTWRPDHIIWCSPVGPSPVAVWQQSKIQQSVDEATGKAVNVAEQNRAAASDALTDVKRQVGRS